MPRSEAEITGGYFLVQIAGGEVALPELPFGEARAWSRASAAAFGPVFASFEKEWKPGEGVTPIEAASELAMGATIDLIAAYDRDGALGGREGIEQLSTSRIRALYRLLYEEAHPFGDDLQAALLQMATMRVNAALADRSAGASSGSGSSQIGASPLETPPLVSLPASSNSSGDKRKSGSAARSVNSSPPPTPQPATRSSQRTSQPASGNP